MVKKKNDRTLEIITHLIGIFSYILGALIIFFLTKEREIKLHSKNALNWQISLAIYSVIIFIISLIYALIFNSILSAKIIFPFTLLLTILTILNIIFCIIAGIKASQGRLWKYPLSLRIIERIDDKHIKNAKKQIKNAFKEFKK